MTEILNPAAEFEYNPRVRELFANLDHAVGAVREPTAEMVVQEDSSRTAPTKEGVLTAAVGSREQGAYVQWFIEVHNERVTTARYQAYGCPHFLAACENLACWLEGRAVSELAQWRWRDVEMELAVPASKRARLLLLDEALAVLSRCF